jgi:anthranilate phosphoribosyltransferase
VASGGGVAERPLDPTQLGVPLARLEDLRGGDPAYNATVVRSVLAGDTGPVRDAVLLNAAAAVVAADAHEEKLPADVLAGDLDDRLRAALEVAAESVDTGTAASVLDRWVAAAGH